jgi:hypothetical protein
MSQSADRKLKAAHKWRAFLTEYGTIVLGVLTALMVVWLHDREAAGEARAALWTLL